MGVQAEPYVALSRIEEKFIHYIDEIKSDYNIVSSQGNKWNWM